MSRADDLQYHHPSPTVPFEPMSDARADQQRTLNDSLRPEPHTGLPVAGSNGHGKRQGRDASSVSIGESPEDEYDELGEDDEDEDEEEEEDETESEVLDEELTSEWLHSLSEGEGETRSPNGKRGQRSSPPTSSRDSDEDEEDEEDEVDGNEEQDQEDLLWDLDPKILEQALAGQGASSLTDLPNLDPNLAGDRTLLDHLEALRAYFGTSTGTRTGVDDATAQTKATGANTKSHSTASMSARIGNKLQQQQSSASSPLLSAQDRLVSTPPAPVFSNLPHAATSYSSPLSKSSNRAPPLAMAASASQSIPNLQSVLDLLSSADPEEVETTLDQLISQNIDPVLHAQISYIRSYYVDQRRRQALESAAARKGTSDSVVGANGDSVKPPNGQTAGGALSLVPSLSSAAHGVVPFAHLQFDDDDDDDSDPDWMPEGWAQAMRDVLGDSKKTNTAGLKHDGTALPTSGGALSFPAMMDETGNARPASSPPVARSASDVPRGGMYGDNGAEAGPSRPLANLTASSARTTDSNVVGADSSMEMGMDVDMDVGVDVDFDANSATPEPVASFSSVGGANTGPGADAGQHQQQQQAGQRLELSPARKRGRKKIFTQEAAEARRRERNKINARNRRARIKQEKLQRLAAEKESGKGGVGAGADGDGDGTVAVGMNVSDAGSKGKERLGAGPADVAMGELEGGGGLPGASASYDRQEQEHSDYSMSASSSHPAPHPRLHLHPPHHHRLSRSASAIPRPSSSSSPYPIGTHMAAPVSASLDPLEEELEDAWAEVEWLERENARLGRENRRLRRENEAMRRMMFDDEEEEEEAGWERRRARFDEDGEGEEEQRERERDRFLASRSRMLAGGMRRTTTRGGRGSSSSGGGVGDGGAASSGAGWSSDRGRRTWSLEGRGERLPRAAATATAASSSGGGGGASALTVGHRGGMEGMKALEGGGIPA